MALSIVNLWVQNTLAEIKASFIGIAEAAGLPVTSWRTGDVSERIVEIVPRVLDQFLSEIIVRAAQALFLDQVTDPGDTGNADTEVKPGWLSVLGEGWYGVTRGGQTFATTTISVTNNTLAPIYPKPGELVFESTVLADDGGTLTFTSTEDDSIYVNADGSVTIAASATVDIPIRADIIGSYSNAGSGDITVVQSEGFGSLSATNATAALGQEREAADDYRARCRRASSRVATGGPSVLYEYAATTGADGEPLQRHDGSGQVGTTRIFVDDGITLAGAVTTYLADDDGPVDAIDEASAHANITGVPLGDITDPIGVVPGVVTYATEPAVGVVVTVVGTAKIKTADAGGRTTTEIKQLVLDALTDYFRTFPIGGLDQVSGAGVLYTSDMEGVARDALAGLYAVNITTPATSTSALALGRVATLTSALGDWTVTVTA